MAEPDLAELIQHAKQFYFEGKNSIAAIRCGMAVEIILRRLYLRLLVAVPTGKQRKELVDLEMANGNYGIERFTVGALAHFCDAANFLGLAEQILDVELGAAKRIDLTPLVDARNRAAHSIQEISPDAAGIALLHTTTLFECLRIAIQDEHQADHSLAQRPDITVDELAYIRLRLEQLEGDAAISKQCQDAITYAQIDPQDALFKLRKILEHIARTLYGKAVGPPRTMTLDKLMTSLREKSVITNRIYKHMENVKSFGNRGAHPGEESYGVKDVETVFISLIVIIDWFFDLQRQAA